MNPNAAKACLVLFQVFLGAISVYCLAHFSFLIFGKKSIFLLAFFLYGFSTFVSQWEVRIITEGLATSSLIFSVYFLYRFRMNQDKRTLLTAGLAITYAVFLRPFLAPLMLILTLFVWLNSQPAKWDGTNNFWKNKSRNLLIFLGPFLLFDGAWTARNYHHFQRIIPLQIDQYAGYDTTDGEKALACFTQAIGEEWVWWKPNSFGAWFYPQTMFSMENFQPPPHDFAPAYNLQDIQRVRKLFKLSFTEPNQGRRAEYDRQVNAILTRYTEAYRRERPLDYYIVSRIRLLWILLANTGTDSLPLKTFHQLKSDIPGLLVKISSCAIYQVVVWLGLLGLLACAYEGSAGGLLLAAIPLCLIGGVVFVARYVENRLLTPVFPFLTVGCGYLIDRICSNQAASGTSKDMR